MRGQSLIAVAVAAAMPAVGGEVGAFEVDNGKPDLQLRWDNTLRYNIATGVEGRDSKIANSAGCAR